MNCQRSLLQNVLNVMYFSQRTCKKLPKGIKYYGFTFYPRSENFKDPPYEPSKLFLIKRIKHMRGTTSKEKHILALLNIDGNKKYKGNISVVKNIPSTNALLWKVKHLVEIKPITWKNELPPLGENFSGTHLRTTGELIISPKLQVTPEQIKITDEMQNNSNKLKRSYLKEYLKKKWLNPFYSSV